MSKERLFDDINEFRAVMKDLGIAKIAFSQVDERRVEQTSQDKLEVLRVVRLELLAYRKDTLYKCRRDDVDLDTVHAMLVEDGFEVTRKNRNII